jgi:hypothetical protein
MLNRGGWVVSCASPWIGLIEPLPLPLGWVRGQSLMLRLRFTLPPCAPDSILLFLSVPSFGKYLTYGLNVGSDISTISLSDVGVYYIFPVSKLVRHSLSAVQFSRSLRVVSIWSHTIILTNDLLIWMASSKGVNSPLESCLWIRHPYSR